MSVREAKLSQKKQSDKGLPGAAIYGTSQKISDSSIIDKVASELFRFTLFLIILFLLFIWIHSKSLR